MTSTCIRSAYGSTSFTWSARWAWSAERIDAASLPTGRLYRPELPKLGYRPSGPWAGGAEAFPHLRPEAADELRRGDAFSPRERHLEGADRPSPGGDAKPLLRDIR